MRAVTRGRLQVTAASAVTTAAIAEATAGIAAVTAGEGATAAGAVTAFTDPGGGAASGWACILPPCLCITRPFGGRAFPTITLTAPTIVGTAQSTNTKR